MEPKILTLSTTVSTRSETIIQKIAETWGSRTWFNRIDNLVRADKDAQPFGMPMSWGFKKIYLSWIS